MSRLSPDHPRFFQSAVKNRILWKVPKNESYIGQLGKIAELIKGARISKGLNLKDTGARAFSRMSTKPGTDLPSSGPATTNALLKRLPKP